MLKIINTIKSKAQDKGVHVIDLLPAFRKYSNHQLKVHKKDPHPNAFAHQIAAKETAERISVIMNK